MVAYFFSIGIGIALCVSQGFLFAQSPQSARSFAFDRGLVDSSEPFAPAANPALLSSRSFFRFNGEWHRADENAYLLSFAYPVSSKISLGLAGYSMNNEFFQQLPSSTLRSNQNFQTLLLSLGHNNAIRWGQQLEALFQSQEFSVLGNNNGPGVSPDDEQAITLSYRLGGYHAFSEKIGVGLLTPPIFRYQYQSLIRSSETQTKTNVDFWKEHGSNTAIPMLGLKWQPSTSLAFALSNRSKEGEHDFQIASDLKFQNFDVTTAINLENGTDEVGAAFGIGGYLKGIDAFAAYDVRKKDFRISISFAPERSRELIDLVDIETSTYTLYPYRLAHNQPEWLAKIDVRNKTKRPIEISIRLKGTNLPAINLGQQLAASGSSTIDVPLPGDLQNAAPGIYQYEVEITAFQRGRHVVKRQLAFELKTAHDWAGESDDLNYFIQPNHLEIFNTARAILATNQDTTKAPAPEQVAKSFYEFLTESFRYLNDPRPLGTRQDRVQYATETLHLKSGDCEDLTILMVSLLESAGIRSAFIEIFPPESEIGHILLIFDSQKNARDVLGANENLQHYIPRQNGTGEPRLFIPLELTKLDLSFKQAWMQALSVYRQMGLDQHGLANGWVKIIDTPEPLVSNEEN